MWLCHFNSSAADSNRAVKLGSVIYASNGNTGYLIHFYPEIRDFNHL